LTFLGKGAQGEAGLKDLRVFKMQVAVTTGCEHWDHGNYIPDWEYAVAIMIIFPEILPSGYILPLKIFGRHGGG